MPNPWIEFLKEHAKKTNTTYRNALSNPDLKAQYQQRKSNAVAVDAPTPVATVPVKRVSKKSVLQVPPEPQPLVPNPKPARVKKLKEIPPNNLSYDNIYYE